MGITLEHKYRWHATTEKFHVIRRGTFILYGHQITLAVSILKLKQLNLLASFNKPARVSVP